MLLNAWLSETQAVGIMCDRVNLPSRVGQKIWYYAKLHALRQGYPTDMVEVAQAIKYASDNREHLKEKV